MELLLSIGVLALSYLIGSIPFGKIIVKIKTGKDILTVESGRTGGTNAYRAAGWVAGILTAILDFLKGACTVWLARTLLPGNIWLEVLSPVLAIVGHNYSIFLVSFDKKGRLQLRGGAGGATSVGGAVGIWFPSAFIIIPLEALIFFGIGYASVTTLSSQMIAILIFAIRAWRFGSPWEYVAYGVLAEILLIWALRPNIRRLISGDERVVGLRAWLRNNKSDLESDNHK